MIVNDFVVAYIVLTLVSLGLCVPAAAAAWLAAGRWKPGISAEARDRIEKSVYLVISLLVLGFCLRLFMIPLWFLTLQSLVGYIPGAMCMAGVHLLAAPCSFIATALKFFIPLAYIYWLILNSLDRRIESQPFMAKKLRLVAPLALLMAAESFFDARFLNSIRPKIVSCCTSLFDLPRARAVQVVRESGSAWAYMFYFFLAICVAGYLLRRRSRFISRSARVVASLPALAALVLFSHTRVSPVMLDTPFHQCIFCLWQAAPDIAIASFAVILGLWLNYVWGVIPAVEKYPAALRFSRRLGNWATALYLAGAAWITARYALKYFMKV